MHYNYVEEDELLMGASVITKNVKMSKVAQLEQELGQRPVLVFGNSTGDVSMAYPPGSAKTITPLTNYTCNRVTSLLWKA